jgi:hypothetical protein
MDFTSLISAWIKAFCGFADENERATLRAKFEPPLSPPRHVKPILFKAFRSTNPIKDVQHLSSWNSSSVGNHRSSSE